MSDEIFLEFFSDASIGRSGWRFKWVWIDENGSVIDDSAASSLESSQDGSFMRQLSAEQADYKLLGILKRGRQDFSKLVIIKKLSK